MIKQFFVLLLFLSFGIQKTDLLAQQALLRPTISSGSASNSRCIATVGEAFISNGNCFLRVGSQPGFKSNQPCSVGTSNLDKVANISVHPNPTSDKLSISIDMDSKMILKAEIVNFLGQIVSEESGLSIGTNELFIAQIPAGSYALLLKDKQGAIKFSKLIIKINQ